MRAIHALHGFIGSGKTTRRFRALDGLLDLRAELSAEERSAVEALRDASLTGSEAAS